MPQHTLNSYESAAKILSLDTVKNATISENSPSLFTKQYVLPKRSLA